MKRLILSSITQTSNYRRVRARKVTEACVNYWWKDKASDDFKNSLVSAILKWKLKVGIYYHHFDMNTDHNYPSNILLLSKYAHGYIHNSQVELKLMRHYNLVLPGYGQGPKAIQLEHKMYAKLFHDLGDKVSSLEDVFIALYDSKIFIDEDVDEDNIVSELERLNVCILDIDDVCEILSDDEVNYDNYVEVDYVDSKTAKRVDSMLNDILKEEISQMERTSIETIKSFLKSNSMSPSKINQYYGRLKIRS